MLHVFTTLYEFRNLLHCHWVITQLQLINIIIIYRPSFFFHSSDSSNTSSLWGMAIMKFFIIQWSPIACELSLHRNKFLSSSFTTAFVLPLVSETKFCTHFNLQAKLVLYNLVYPVRQQTETQNILDRTVASSLWTSCAVILLIRNFC